MNDQLPNMKLGAELGNVANKSVRTSQTQARIESLRISGVNDRCWCKARHMLYSFSQFLRCTSHSKPDQIIQRTMIWIRLLCVSWLILFKSCKKSKHLFVTVAHKQVSYMWTRVWSQPFSIIKSRASYISIFSVLLRLLSPICLPFLQPFLHLVKTQLQPLSAQCGRCR